MSEQHEDGRGVIVPGKASHKSRNTQEILTRFGRMIVFSNDTIISRSLIEYGEWAWREIRFLLGILKKDAVVIEVGAFIGTHTLAFASKAKEVYAFEANGLFHDVLGQNISLNQLRNARSFHLAIGSKKQLMRTSEPSTGVEENYGHDRPSSFAGEHSSAEVRCSPLDDFFAANPLTACDLIKIDVEGMELDVLQGASSLLEKFSPTVFAECNSLQGGAPVFMLMRDLGYSAVACSIAAYHGDNFNHNPNNMFGAARETSLLFFKGESPQALTDRDGIWFFPIKTLDDLSAALLAKPQYYDEVLKETSAAKRLERGVARERVLAEQGDEPAGNGRAASLPFGINLAGSVNSEKGVGEAARSHIRCLKAAGIPFVVNNIVDDTSVNSDRSFLDFSQTNPYMVNLIHVNAEWMPYFVSQKGEPYFEGRYNIAYWAWELSAFPREWDSAFKRLDEIWALSNFALDSIALASPLPVVRIPPSISISEKDFNGRLSRARFGIPENKFIYLFVFDYHSFIGRKNPDGLIQAFKTAFTPEEDALLVLKGAHSSDRPEDHARVKEMAQGDNIIVMDEMMSREEILSLISASDCYVSLHRSEGFGLTLAEAMALGKPVIGTAYSGNMDFMTPSNSYLVKYRLVENQKDHGPYKKGCVWAEPDIEDAARLMRRACEKREEAEKIGRAAALEIRKQFCPEEIAKLYKKRLERIKESVSKGETARERADVDKARSRADQARSQARQAREETGHALKALDETRAALDAKWRELNETQGKLDYTTGRLSQTEADLGENRAEMDRVTRELNAELNRVTRELNAQLHQKWRELTATQNELSGKLWELSQSRAQLSTVKNSISWKITRPLRRMKKLAHGDTACSEITPANHLEAISPGLWKATGADPQFLFQCPKFLPGWYRFQASLEINGHSTANPRIFLDTGHGFNQENSIALGPIRYGDLDIEIFLPLGTSAVRFDPAEFPCEFKLENVALTRLDEDVAATLEPKNRYVFESLLAADEIASVHDEAPSAPANEARQMTVEKPADAEPHENAGATPLEAPEETLPEIPLREVSGICIVTPFLWPKIGDEPSHVPYLKLAEALAGSGENLTLLYTGCKTGDSSLADHRRYCAGRRMAFAQLPDPNIRINDTYPGMHESYFLFRQLLEHQDRIKLVILPEQRGPGFYAMLAKHQGLAFANTRFAVELRGPSFWNLANQKELPNQVNHLVVDFMEKESVRLADEVICSNPNLISWMKEHGWHLPDKILTLPNPSVENAPQEAPREPAAFPLVSVCILTRNRPKFLGLALDSIRSQDYPNFEIILVDDGSTFPEALAFLDSIEPEFKEKGWQIVRQENRYQGAARNNAARHARGEYLFFMDDDNVAKTGELSTFVAVAQKTGADILTCTLEFFTGQEGPQPTGEPAHLRPFLGGCLTVGMFDNIFGDTNSLIRKSVFDALGGFVEERERANEDWEFFSRAVLTGYALETVPLPLFRYRVQPQSMVRITDTYANHLQHIGPYLKMVPPGFENVLLFSLGSLIREFQKG